MSILFIYSHGNDKSEEEILKESMKKFHKTKLHLAWIHHKIQKDNFSNLEDWINKITKKCSLDICDCSEYVKKIETEPRTTPMSTNIRFSIGEDSSNDTGNYHIM